MNTWKQCCERIVRVGSRETCNPPPMDTDEDWLVLVDSEKYQEFYSFVTIDFDQTSQEGYTSEDGTVSPFTCYRFEDQNLIVTTDLDFFNKFMQASNEAKRLNLLEKSDRIALFQRILYENSENSSVDSPQLAGSFSENQTSEQA